MHKLLEKLDKELHKYADKEGDLTAQEWQVVFNAIEARKNLLTSMAMEGEDSSGHYYDEDMKSGTYRRYPMHRSSNTYSSTYDKYDNDGYSNRRMMGSSRRGKDTMLTNLYQAMDEASSEEERKMIQNCINKLEY